MRSNEEWLSDLRGPDQDQALADLRVILRRGLGYALSSRSSVDDQAIEDFCQDALLKILDNLDTFRGESLFTTWAQKIAVHTAYTELRRRRWRDVSLDGIIETDDGGEFIPRTFADPTAGPEQRATQTLLLNTLRRVITYELTDKQRQAMTAIVLRGMPLAEVAERMDSNPNALYKLLHDARKRLKERILEEGLSPDDVLAAFST